MEVEVRGGGLGGVRGGELEDKWAEKLGLERRNEEGMGSEDRGK